MFRKEGKGFIFSRWFKGIKMRKNLVDLGIKMDLVGLKMVNGGGLRREGGV